MFTVDLFVCLSKNASTLKPAAGIFTFKFFKKLKKNIWQIFGGKLIPVSGGPTNNRVRVKTNGQLN